MRTVLLQKIAIYAIIFFISIQNANAQQKISFNRDWQFIGIEIRTNQELKDSIRKLGKNWNDQFLIEKLTDDDSSVLNADTSYNDQLDIVKKHAWQNATLPHTAFPEPLIIKNPREGYAFYKKSFFINKSQKGEIITVEFEGAMQIASVWFNGHFMKTHLGGYLPFSIDITKYIHYGNKNVLFVKLDNRPNAQIPPGKPVKKLDFIYYSGIYRDVWLNIQNPLHITNANAVDQITGGGIFVTYPKVSKDSALINIRTDIVNEYTSSQHFSLIQYLINKKNQIVASVSSDNLSLNKNENKIFIRNITLRNPSLWHPDSPYLYRLKTVVLMGRKTVDSSTVKIGIRSIFISKEKGLLINGAPFRIEGTNRHMSYPWIGNALSNTANYRDAEIIKNAGINCIRLCHYPQDPSFYDACDSLGMLLIDCIPGWQFFNTSMIFRERVAEDIQQTIRRDRNHPSVFLWEMSLNETYPPAAFRCFQNETAKREWPDSLNFYTSGDSYFVKACWDVPYDDWANNVEARNNTTYPDNAFLVREYGDYEFGGGSSTSRQVRSSGETGMLQQAWNLQWEHNRNRRLYPRCIGDLNWAFFDGLAGVTTGIEGWGLADIYRIPKFSYYFFKSQKKNAPPMVYIADYRFPYSSSSKIIVYSNCNQIGLYINGKMVAKQKPDNGPDTHYGTALDKGGRPFTGGDAQNLTSPPFTFFNVPYSSGELKAVGYNNGNPVTQYTIHTPGAAQKLILSADLQNHPLVADGADAVFIHAVVSDENGYPIYSSDKNIHFHVIGDAKIISPKNVNAEAGIATILLQAGLKKGEIILTADSPNLKSDTLTIDLK